MCSVRLSWLEWDAVERNLVGGCQKIEVCADEFPGRQAGLAQSESEDGSRVALVNIAMRAGPIMNPSLSEAVVKGVSYAVRIHMSIVSS